MRRSPPRQQESILAACFDSAAAGEPSHLNTVKQQGCCLHQIDIIAVLPYYSVGQSIPRNLFFNFSLNGLQKRPCWWRRVCQQSPQYSASCCLHSAPHPPQLTSSATRSASLKLLISHCSQVCMDPTSHQCPLSSCLQNMLVMPWNTISKYRQ